MRGYMFHITEGYSNHTKKLSEVFSGNACKISYNDRKQYIGVKYKEKPLKFILNFLFIIIICMSSVRGFWWVDKEVSKEKVVRVLSEKREIVKEQVKMDKKLDSTEKDVEEVKEVNKILIEQIVRDSVNLTIKKEQ